MHVVIDVLVYKLKLRGMMPPVPLETVGCSESGDG